MGYFTTLEDERAGWTGGLLVLNGGGRPLEFQCTLPIRPSRAHEILFGSSLRHHLISEVIGPTLLKKCRTPISLLCCQQVEALKLQETAIGPGADASGGQCTVALVVSAAEEDEGPIDESMLQGFQRVELAETPILVPNRRLTQVESLLPRLNDLADAAEPFERICEAIREAQSQVARAA